MPGNKQTRPKRTPLGPEKVVEKEVLALCESLGIYLSVIDSKAIYSKFKEAYSKNYCVPEGAPDLWGNDSNGVAVFLELKAPGKLKTLRASQRLFLERKIEQGCFAACVDSPKHLFELYVEFRKSGKAPLLAALQAI
jgi:hypothetical protein